MFLFQSYELDYFQVVGPLPIGLSSIVTEILFDDI